jgi:putative glutamine amidotransferase
MPEGLIATAWSDDGLIEAAEAPDKRFVVGLQCHPEELWNTTAPEFSRLFASFIEACQYAVEPAGVSSTRTPS